MSRRANTKACQRERKKLVRWCEDVGVDPNELLLADGLESAFVGVIERCGQPPVAVFDKNRCVDAMIRQGMTEEDAIEYLEFNTFGAWVGEKTPGWLIRY